MATATLTAPEAPAVRPELAEWRKQDAAIAKLAEQYGGLKIDGIDDKKGFALVHDARLEVKHLRVAVEKKRVELKADALAYGRAVDSEAKRLTGLLEPIETHLEAEETAVVQERERIKQAAAEAHKAKVKARFDLLKAVGFDGDYMAVPEMTDDAFADAVAKARAAKEERDRLASLEREAAEQRRITEQAEAARLRQIEAEAQEQARKAAAEVEARRQAEEAAQAEQRRKEKEALNAERIRLAEIQAEQEAERQRLAEQQRQIELERARQEAAERSRMETERRLTREAEQRREVELRREADAKAAEAAEAKRIAEQAAADEAARIAARQIDERDTVSQAANKACEHLPEGWTIRIQLERRSGCVTLENPEGDEVAFPTGDGGFVSDLNDALQHAIEAAQAADPFGDDAA